MADDKEEERRWKILRVDPQLILEMFCTGEHPRDRMLVTGLPKDTIFKDCHYHYPSQCFDMILEHESFDDIPLYEDVPMVPPCEVTFVRVTEE